MSEKKCVLITGGTRGIGLAVAQKLCNDYQVVVTGTSEKSISHLEGHPSIRAVVHQFSGESDEKQLWDKSAEVYGKEPQILINNAAITDDALMLRMKKEQWLRVMDVNINAVFSLSQLAVKSMMRARWGRVVQMSSVVAHKGNIGQANYIATKCAIEGMMRAMALETAARGVTVNALAPGFITTDMTEGLSEAVKKNISDQIPMQRLGTVDEIAGVLAFLISDDAAYITGQVIHVNGGMHLG